MSFIRNQAVSGLPDTSYRMRVWEGKRMELGISHGLQSVITYELPERMRSKEFMVVRLNLLG